MTIPVECRCGCVIDTKTGSFSRICKRHQGDANISAREELLEYANKQLRRLRREDDEDD